MQSVIVTVNTHFLDLFFKVFIKSQMLSFTTCYQISVKQKMIHVKKNIISRLDYSVCRKGPRRWSLMQFRVGPQLNFYKSLILAYILFKLPMHVPGSTAASGLGPAQFPGRLSPPRQVHPPSCDLSCRILMDHISPRADFHGMQTLHLHYQFILCTCGPLFSSHPSAFIPLIIHNTFK